VATGFLVAYYLLAIETYLATHAIGRFKISWGPFGGTELRILVALVNGLVLWRPTVGTAQWLVFDVFGAGAAATLAVLSVVAGITGTRILARAEGWAPALDATGAARGNARRPAPLVVGEALSQV